jgi:hypothetical protein
MLSSARRDWFIPSGLCAQAPSALAKTISEEDNIVLVILDGFHELKFFRDASVSSSGDYTESKKFTAWAFRA